MLVSEANIVFYRHDRRFQAIEIQFFAIISQSKLYNFDASHDSSRFFRSYLSFWHGFGGAWTMFFYKLFEMWAIDSFDSEVLKICKTVHATIQFIKN